MSYTREVTIWCDKCGNWEQEPGTTATRLRAKLIDKKGWKRAVGQDLCPDCDDAEPGGKGGEG